MGKTTVPLMPSTVTTKVLLVASTAKLLAKLMVGVVPMAIAGVEAIPRVAKFDLAIEEFENPSNVVANVLVVGTVMAILEVSPVVPDFIVKILLTESYSTFIPKRCSAAALSATPFGTAFKPDRPFSFKAIEVTGKPNTSFLVVVPDLTEMTLVLSVNLKP
mgnify:CR=1 FL=1